MVRTKAGSVSTKAIGAKAPGKVAITAILSGNGPKVRNHGNSYHPRNTPGWQKPITCFMKQEAESSKDDSTEDEEDDENVGGKRPKLEAEDSKDDSKEENAEEDGIPGIPAGTSSSNKTVDTHLGDMDIEEEENIKAKKKSKGKGKGKAKGNDINNEKVAHSDMDVGKQEDDIGNKDEKNDESNEKIEDMEVTEDASKDKKTDGSMDGVENKAIEDENEDKDTSKDNEKDKSMDGIEDKAIAEENKENDEKNEKSDRSD